MLLGLSSGAIDETADLQSVIGNADAGIQAAAELSAFAEAAWRQDESLGGARAALRAAVGDAGLVEAAQTVAVFRSLNIAADSSGIPLDEDWKDAAAGFVGELGLDEFPTAANTPGY
ncbi:MAG: hypothetical protein P8J50_14380 [Acidimicrobiales bacterium]|jgi:hypothetical protein|nr:hypothetical protein [Acidimicrobiales bacterium]